VTGFRLGVTGDRFVLAGAAGAGAGTFVPLAAGVTVFGFDAAAAVGEDLDVFGFIRIPPLGFGANVDGFALVV
jgi:hypothetical protein